MAWKKNLIEDSVRHFFDLRETLSDYAGIVVKGEAIVIPKSLRRDIKHRLHSAHLGYDSMIRRERGTIFWTNMQCEIRQIADNCYACQEMKPRPTKTPLTQPDDATTPWEKIGLDFFQIKKYTYLVSIDSYSNYIDIALPTTTSVKLIKTLKKQFSHFGIPKIIVTDGGLHKFTTEWRIKHVTSSPNHQRANGKAESAVKVMKHLITKCDKEGSDQFEAPMEQRNTPRQDTCLIPCEMMYGRSTRTRLPKLFQPNLYRNPKREQRKKSVKHHYDKTAHDRPQLEQNQNVFFERKPNEKWILGKIIYCLHNQTYIVQSQDGATYRRNRLHIRPKKIEAVIRDKSPACFENKRRQAETSHEEKTITSHEPFILTENKTPHNSNTITPTNLTCENRDLLENSMQETPAYVDRKLSHCDDLHVSAKNQKN